MTTIANQTDSDQRPGAYGFAIPIDQAAAILKVGGRKHRVAVTKFSWESYSVIVPKKLSHIALGSKAKLTHQGLQFDVVCSAKNSIDSSCSEVELQRTDNGTQSLNASNKSRVVSEKIALNGRDPVMTASFLFCILLLAASMPGIGDTWGTTGYITRACQGFGDVLFKQILGLR